MYSIKITIGLKTIMDYNNILTLSQCYQIIMSTYRHLKRGKIQVFSILLYDNEGKIIRVTNKYVCGVQDVSRDYVSYHVAN